MEAGIDSRPTGNRCLLAWSGIQALLDLGLAASEACRKEMCQQGIARTHFPYGLRELDLGCAADSWRIEDARFRYLGTICAAMDFFTVPTLTFGILRCFFAIAHDRRRILHCNVTRHPSSALIVQQLREAFPYEDRKSVV